jgi:hypothetical protein
MKKTVVFFFLAISTVASAQDLWMQPDKFIYRRGQTINLRFFSGEVFKGKNWKGSKNQIELLRLFFDNVSDQNLDDNLSAEKGDSIQVALFDEGTVVITGQTKLFSIKNDSVAESLFIDSADFDFYHTKLKPDSINYLYSLKTILQVAENTSNVGKEKTGLPIEIVPKDHPYSFKKDGRFKIKILMWDKPLKNTKVRVLHKLDNKVSEFEYVTDNDGEIKFFLSLKGEWMVRCVKTAKLETGDKNEWRTYIGILTWGYY